MAALSKFGGYDTSMRWVSGDDDSGDAWQRVRLHAFINSAFGLVNGITKKARTSLGESTISLVFAKNIARLPSPWFASVAVSFDFRSIHVELEKLAINPWCPP